MSELSITPATPDDIPLILDFIRELAGYEQALDQVSATEEDLHTDLFSPEACVHALVCRLGEEPVGFAVYFFNYSTWLGKRGLFLEDIYISPQFRRNGAGRALLQYLAEVATEHNCGRMEWNVLNWNEPAIRFYESLGATPQSEWTGYRLSGVALRNFGDK